MEITKLLWMSEEEFNDYKTLREQFQNMRSKYKDHPMIKSFSQDKAISLVFKVGKDPTERSKVQQCLQVVGIYLVGFLKSS